MVAVIGNVGHDVEDTGFVSTRANIMVIESIGSVLKKKGHEICSVAPDATVHDALKLMAAKNSRQSWSFRRALSPASSLRATTDARSFWRGKLPETCASRKS